MKKLNSNELKNVKGGFGFWAGAGLVALFVFAVGVIDGVARPVKCG